MPQPRTPHAAFSMPAAASASADSQLSIVVPPTELCTRPMGTSFIAGTFCLRCSAVKKHVAEKAASDALLVPVTTHGEDGPRL